MDLLIAAAVGFVSAVTLIGVREVVRTHGERKRDKAQFEALLFLFIKEVAAGAERCTQYVRQVALGQASGSKLTVLTSPEQMSRAGQLGNSPKLISALHDIYRLFDLVRHQIEKFSTGQSEEFGRILAFVRDDFTLFTKGMDDLISIAQTIFKGDRETESKKLIEDMHKTRKECSDWLAAHKCFIEATEQWKTSLEVDVQAIKSQLGTPTVKTKFIRCLVRFLHTHGVFGGGKNGFVNLSHLRSPGVIALGCQLSDTQCPELSGIKKGEFDAIIAGWYEFVKKHDPQPYDPR